MTPARPLKIGDRVVITMAGSKYRRQTGTVLWVSTTKAGLTSYTVQLDSSKAQLSYQLLDLSLLT
jgi:hypothetical protein